MLKSPRIFQQLAAEIRRRKVLRVVAIYAVTAWVILQFAEIAFEPLGYPDWALRALIIAAFAGLPVAFILAWVIDIRPEGLIFDLPLIASNDDAPRQRRKSDLIFAILLIVILAGGSYYLVSMLIEETRSVPEGELTQAPTVANSIAVLAFENFDGETETGYFAAGLADEILQLLAGLPELNVSSRTSSFQFSGERVDPIKVAESLGVNHLLEGSARQQGNRVRVSARLVDGKKGFNQWVQSYERSLNDIFLIQREIAQNVVNQLKVVLSLNSKKRLDQQVTASPDAYLPFLQGTGRLRSSLDADVMRDASQRFQQAIDIDANFARAYAGLCEAHLRLYEINKSIADFEVAETACDTSSQLDPGLNAEVSLALGKLYGYRGWLDRAEEQLNKAITLDTEPVDAYIELSRIRVGQDRIDDAERLLTKANSLRNNYWATHEALASFYYRVDRYAEAIYQYEKAISLAPEVATAHAGKGAAHWMLAEYDNAIESYQASLDIKPSRQAYTNIGSLHYYAGRFQQAIDNQRKALELAPNDHRVWGRLAESYHFLPNPEKAKESFQRAAELAEKNLLVNDKDWRTTSLLATYLAHIGKKEAAHTAANNAITLSNQNAEAYYFKGLAHERLKESDLALAALKKAIEIDESYKKLIISDPFLKALSKDL
jgi:TolB-like protein/Flp pilus assembly protein TadD